MNNSFVRSAIDNPRSAISRRELLRSCGMGFGALALGDLLAQSARSDNPQSLNPMAPKSPHFPARAKHVIHIFLNGGPSQVDTFDPKPALEKYAGKALSRSLRTERKTGGAMPSPFKFQRYGQ